MVLLIAQERVKELQQQVRGLTEKVRQQQEQLREQQEQLILKDQQVRQLQDQLVLKDEQIGQLHWQSVAEGEVQRGKLVVADDQRQNVNTALAQFIQSARAAEVQLQAQLAAGQRREQQLQERVTELERLLAAAGGGQLQGGDEAEHDEEVSRDGT